jgi:hypothetical protein
LKNINQTESKKQMDATIRAAALLRPMATMAFAFASFAGGATAVSAAMPDNLADIVYTDTDWGREQLRARGYTMIQSDHHNGKRIEYWWQHSSRTCIKARSADGKFDDLSETTRTDCNQYDKSMAKDDNAAAIAIGAAALLGAAALAHQSHERDNKHGESSQSVADFDRGYRDGMYNQPYHNYGNASAYSDGYSEGNRKRDEETQHHPRQGGYSGYQQYVSLDDLLGARAGSADSELRSRGFTDTGGYKQGEKSLTTWHNGRTHQCVQAVTRDGHIKRFESIDENSCL